MAMFFAYSFLFPKHMDRFTTRPLTDGESMSDLRRELEKLVGNFDKVAEALFDLGRAYEREQLAKHLGLVPGQEAVKLNGHARAKSTRKFGEIAGAVRATVAKHGTGSIALLNIIHETQASQEGDGLTDRQLRAAVKALVVKKELEKAGRARYRATAKLHQMVEAAT